MNRSPCPPRACPYVCIHTEIDRFPERRISWHWRASLEFVYVQEGTVQLRVPDRTVLLTRGEAVFINTGVLHEYAAAAEGPCSVFAHLVRTEFLSGAYGSVFEEKYFSPVTRTGVPQLLVIQPDSRERLRMIENLHMAAQLLSESGKTVIEISEACGFSSPGYFARVFRETFGCPPKEWQKKQGMSEI